MALIFYSSSQSDPAPVLTHVVWDKLLHLGGYAVLGILFFRALWGEGVPMLSAVMLAIFLTSAYGATDEWHQAFTPQRQSDVHDWMADTLGGTIGAVTGWAAVGALGFARSRR